MRAGGTSAAQEAGCFRLAIGSHHGPPKGHEDINLRLCDDAVQPEVEVRARARA